MMRKKLARFSTPNIFCKKEVRISPPAAAERFFVDNARRADYCHLRTYEEGIWNLQWLSPLR